MAAIPSFTMTSDIMASLEVDPATVGADISRVGAAYEKGGSTKGFVAGMVKNQELGRGGPS